MEFVDWTRAFLMMGDSPVGMREVLLAADGSMYALLQGEDALGALHTVRLDDEGRMSAFVIDSVDAWGHMLSIGNAELAVRLGSPDRYDRRGQVREFVTFEYGLANVTLDFDAHGTTAALTPAKALFGGYSLAVNLAAHLNAWMFIELNVPADVSSVHGLEVAFATATADIEIEIKVDRWTGARWQQLAIRFDGVAKTLRVLDYDGVYRLFAEDVELWATAELFHMMKVVADLDGGDYYRFMFQGKEYDVAGYGAYDRPLESAPRTSCWVYVRNNIAAARTVYVDNIILTVAEPE